MHWLETICMHLFNDLHLQFFNLILLIGNFTVCGFYLFLFIFHALCRADDAYFIGKIYTL